MIQQYRCDHRCTVNCCRTHRPFVINHHHKCCKIWPSSSHPLQHLGDLTFTNTAENQITAVSGNVEKVVVVLVDTVHFIVCFNQQPLQYGPLCLKVDFWTETEPCDQFLLVNFKIYKLLRCLYESDLENKLHDGMSTKQTENLHTKKRETTVL